MKNQDYIINGLMNAGYRIARSDNKVYMVKLGRSVVELVYNKQGLVYIMQGKCVLWKA